MDAELKRKWVAALRSTEYEQARQELYRVNAVEGDENIEAYCCIGVGYCITGYPAPISTMDTTSAAKALGLTLTQERLFVSMNDDQEKSFAEIADYIEANL